LKPCKTKERIFPYEESYFHGREALRKGLIKGVGDGSTIRAFDGPWISANLNGRSLFKPLGAKITMVEEAIDMEHICRFRGNFHCKIWRFDTQNSFGKV
jgi:hypothetical protein